VWRRATGARRRLLHGLIQVAVGYEHNKRGNPRGRRSLLRQGAAKLRYFVRRPGVREIRQRALDDAEREGPVTPPKVLVALEGLPARRPARAIEVRIPPAGRR
jgi:hypothetical protein